MISAIDFTPDMQAIQKTLSGDLDAFDNLVLKYQPIAYGRAIAILGDPMLAEDVTQESFIKAFQKIHTLRGDSFQAWLLKIVTNTSISQLRYQKSLRTQPLDVGNEEGEDIETPYWLADSSESIEDTIDHNEDLQRLYQTLDELPEIYRRVLILVDVHEIDLVVAAKMLGIPLGTVKSRIARARSQVRVKLLDQVRRENFNVGGSSKSSNLKVIKGNNEWSTHKLLDHPNKSIPMGVD